MCLPFVWRNRGGKPRAQSLVLSLSLCLIGLLVKTIQSAFASGQLNFTLRVFLHCVLKSSISRISDEISVFHAWKWGRILVSCLLWTQSSCFFNLQLSHMFDPFLIMLVDLWLNVCWFETVFEDLHNSREVCVWGTWNNYSALYLSYKVLVFPASTLNLDRERSGKKRSLFPISFFPFFSSFSENNIPGKRTNLLRQTVAGFQNPPCVFALF